MIDDLATKMKEVKCLHDQEIEFSTLPMLKSVKVTIQAIKSNKL